MVYFGVGYFWEYQVEEYDVCVVFVEGCECVRVVFGDFYFVVFVMQQVCQWVGEVGFVFDEKDMGYVFFLF